MNAAIAQGTNWSSGNTTVTFQATLLGSPARNLIAKIGEGWIQLWTADGRANHQIRLNAILAENGLPGERVFAKQFDWFVDQVGGPIPFFSGMRPQLRAPLPPQFSSFSVDHYVQHNRTSPSRRCSQRGNTIALLNDLNLYSETVEKRGGTKLKKTPLLVTTKSASSAKYHNGSFDWFNTQHTMLRWVIRLSTSYLI